MCRATSTTSAHVFLTRLKSTSTAAAGGPEHLFGITNIIRLFASGFLVPQRGRGPDATDPSFLALQTYQQKQASLGSHVTHNHSYLLSCELTESRRENHRHTRANLVRSSSIFLSGVADLSTKEVLSRLRYSKGVSTPSAVGP